MATVAIVQARMGSARLPGKVLEDVAGHPLLWYVVHRVKQARHVDLVVVATTDRPADQRLVSLAPLWDVGPYAGAEHDVLRRYMQVVNFLRLKAEDLVVRITADCPLIDPDLIDRTIEQVRNRHRWASNIVPRTWPDGLDVEVFTVGILRELDHLTTDPADREHVTPELYRRPGMFGDGGRLHCPLPLGDLRWTIDTPEDLAWLRAIRPTLRSWDVGWQEILGSGPLALRRAA